MRREDIVVVGGGIAGSAAALAARKAGASVTLLDEHPEVGGYLRWSISTEHGLQKEYDERRGFEIAYSCWTQLYNSGVNVQRRSIVWGLFDDLVLGVSNPTSSYRLKADKIILATGSTDVVVPFAGYELAGVMTARAALIAMNVHRVLPGKRAGIVGDGPDLAELNASLEAAGVDVALHVPEVSRAAASGDGAVQFLSDGGDPVAVDVVITALGVQPDVELALHAQVKTAFSPAFGMHLPERSEVFETSVPGLFAVGGAVGTARAAAEGAVAGCAASNSKHLEAAQETLASAEEISLAGSPAGRLADDVVVCRCDEIRADAIRQAIAGGATTINDVKRRTRAGMGVCQGIFCTGTIANMINVEADVPLEQIVPMTARPPARLISLAEIASTTE
jgi:thioredoxin reductase/bacterioferritin-associated ferredoxin